MSEVEDRNAEIAASERDIDELFRRLRRRIAEIFEPYAAQDSLTLVNAVRINQQIDQAVDEIYGRYRGDTSSPLYQMVVDRCESVWQREFSRSADLAREIIADDPVLARAIPGAAEQVGAGPAA